MTVQPSLYKHYSFSFTSIKAALHCAFSALALERVFASSSEAAMQRPSSFEQQPGAHSLTTSLASLDLIESRSRSFRTLNDEPRPMPPSSPLLIYEYEKFTN